jgi:hypothetical protein
MLVYKMASVEEKAKLVKYVHESGSIVAAQRRFRLEFNRAPPHRNLIRKWVKQFSEIGDVKNKKSPGRPKIPDQIVDNVRTAMLFSPHTSVRRLALQLQIPPSTVHKILHSKLKFRAYKIQVVQHLQVADYAARMDGCNALIQNIDNDNRFLENIIFSDEATFHISGRVNRHNCRIWGDENPHELYEHERDSSKVSVWCGMAKDQIYGPFFFDERTVNGASYLNMLQNFFVPQLQQVPGLLRRVIFQQDGAPPHFALDVRAYLDQTFTGRWIGRAGSLAWPPRSPDLNPLDFYLWGHIKTNVYRTKPGSIDELKQRITDSVAAIPAAHLQNAFREFERRIRLIIVNNGAHVEVY